MLLVVKVTRRETECDADEERNVDKGKEGRRGGGNIKEEKGE